mgnify:FL=1
MEKLIPFTGECFCGSVKYQINGKLRDAKSCHCSRCRKAFNAQASAAASVESSEFKWLSGEELLTSYVGVHGYGLQFCETCGSTLCTIYKDEVIQVTLGCVNGEPNIEIAQHIFVGSKASWEVMPEGVVQYEERPPENG